MKPMFMDELRVKIVDEGYQLTSPLRYARKLEILEVPTGFVTNFASVPRVVRPFITGHGKDRYAATLHDYLYSIKQDIELAISSGDALKAAENLRKTGISTFSDPNVSKASIFINKGPTAAFDSVFNARDPRLESQKLIDLVSSDETGEALEGLRTGFMDYLVNKSSDGDFISGQKLAEITSSQKGRAVIENLLPPEEAARLFMIVRTAQRLDSARAAKPSAEGISGDRISGASNMLLGVLGAAYGRQVSSNLGGATIQIPSMFAEKFRSLGVSGLINPARRLIVDAMQDEKLFRQVLMAKDPEKLSPEATRLFNAWASGAVAREATKEEETQ